MLLARTLSLVCALGLIAPALTTAVPAGATGILSVPSLDNPLKESIDAFDRGDYQQSIDLLTLYLGANPKDIDALVRRGIAYAKLKKNELALADFDRAKAISPDSPRVALVRGACLYEQSQYKAAIDDLQIAIEGYPQDNFPLVLLTFCYYHTDAYDKCLTVAKKALALGYSMDQNLALMMAASYGELKRFKEAEQLLAQLCDKPGATAEAWIARGNCAGYQEKFVEAANYYQKALTLEPGNADALYHLAICKLATNKNEVGIKELEAAVNAAPKAVKLRLFRAELLFKLKRYNEALADYKILEELAPDNYKVFRGEAAVLALTGQFDAVLVKAERACQLKPEDAPSQLLRATCLAAYNRFDEAKVAFDMAVKYGDEGSQYYLARARFLSGQKKYKESLEDYDKGLKPGEETDEQLAERLLPLIEVGLNERVFKDVNTLTAHGYDGSWIYLVRGTVNATRGNYQASIDDLEKFAAKNPKASSIHALLAKIYMGAGNYTDTVKAATRAIENNPSDDDSRRIRGTANFCLRNYQDALDDLNFLLNKNDNDRILLELAGFSYLGLNQNTLGEKCFDKIIANFPDHHSGFLYKGLYLADTGDKNRAYELLSSAIKIAPTRASLYTERAKIALELDEQNKAIADLTQALALQPDNVEALDKRAGIYFLVGDYEHSKADLNQLIKAKPHSFMTYLRLAELDQRLGLEKQARADRDTFINMPLTEERDLIERSNFLKENGLVAQALKDAFSALELYPHSRHALYAISDLFELTDSTKEADYLLSLKKIPRYSSLYSQIDYCLSSYYEQKRNYPKALSYLKAASLDKDLSDKVDTQKAIIYYRQKKYKDAEQQFALNIEHQPQNYENYLWRGRMYKALKKYDLALADFDHALLLAPGSIDTYKSKAMTLSEINKPKAALHAVEQALDRQTQKSLELLEFKAFYQTDCAMYQEAIDTYNQAIALAPHTAALYLDRGIAYIYLDKYDEGLADCSMVLALDPTRWEALVNLGTCYKAKGDYKQAIHCYKRALLANPKWHDTYRALANCEFMMDDYSSAIKDYTTALKYNPRSQILYINRGSARGAMGDYKGLLTDTNIAHQLGKPTAVSLKNISIALNKLGQNEDSESKLRLALKDDPAAVANYISLATLLADKKPQTKDTLLSAIIELDKALALSQDNAQALQKKVALLLKLNKNEQALSVANEYLESKPADSAMLALKVESLLNLHRTEEALKTIELIKDTTYDGTAIHTLKGMALARSDQEQEALKEFASALTIDKTDRVALMERAKLELRADNARAALSDLNSAIAASNGDGRLYILRSVCYTKLGNKSKAQSDMQKATNLLPEAVSDTGNILDY